MWIEKEDGWEVVLHSLMLGRSYPLGRGRLEAPQDMQRRGAGLRLSGPGLSGCTLVEIGGEVEGGGAVNRVQWQVEEWTARLKSAWILAGSGESLHGRATKSPYETPPTIHITPGLSILTWGSW